MKTLCIIWVMLITLPAFAQLDLHAHLEIKPGVGPLIRGDFDQAPRAKNWRSFLKTKASQDSLRQPPKLIVIALYGHPFFSNLFHFELKQNVENAINQEYEKLLAFVKANSNRFGIAKNPHEARALLQDGKSVFVLSIEGAYGSLENETLIRKWIDERGVAIVTPFHLTEDDFGGVALMSNFIAFFNSPIEITKSILLTGGACLRSFCKSNVGVKPEGRTLIENLQKRKVWIDLAHANEIEARELLADMAPQKLPLLVTHTQIREVFPAERGISDIEIDYLKTNGGMIGIIPSDGMLLKASPGASPSDCASGVSAFKRAFQYAQNKLGDLHVVLGSDVNAPLVGLAPHCAVSESRSAESWSSLEKEGYYTYSQWGELSNYVSPRASWNTEIVEEFLNQWERVRP